MRTRVRISFIMWVGLLGMLLPHAVAQDLPDTLLRAIERKAGEYNLNRAELDECDKIITFGRDVHVGRIRTITYSDIWFTAPRDTALQHVRRSDVSQVLFAGGRRDVFIPLNDRSVNQADRVNPDQLIVKNQKDWMKVRVTENPDEVRGLLPCGKLSAKYEAEVGNMPNDELMRHAGNVLRKKAVHLKASCVLIDTKFFYKAYGDLPRVEVTAVAYCTGAGGETR